MTSRDVRVVIMSRDDFVMISQSLTFLCYNHSVICQKSEIFNSNSPEIQFPSDQYSLKLSNTTIGEISDDTTVN